MASNGSLKTMVFEILPSQISSTKLSGKENYQQWKKGVQIFLTGRGKQRHLIDNPPKSDETVYKEWVCNDVKSVHILWNSMESYIMDPVTHLDKTKEMWEYLNLLYCGKV